MPEKWLWLQRVLGYGSGSVRELMREYGSADGVYTALKSGKLDENKFFTPVQRKRLHSLDPEDMREEINRIYGSGVRMIEYGSESYPEGLTEISDPPLLLFVKGTLPDIKNRLTVTVVGPRKPSEYGIRAAFSLSRRLAAAGCIIISGGALGVDSMAHKGALSANAPTVSVLGCGFDINYPASNRLLRERIASEGCLISEYSPDFSGAKYTYPLRNRILSGMSRVTVVVEAGEKSGTLVTARYAAEQGRDIFVVPGRPDVPECAGSNKLIADGAMPLLSVTDILGRYYPEYGDTLDTVRAAAISCTLNDLNAELSNKSTPKRDRPQKMCDTGLLGEEANRVLSGLPEEFIGDEIAGLCSDISSVLIELEIAGIIERLPGGRYRRLDK